MLAVLPYHSPLQDSSPTMYRTSELEPDKTPSANRSEAEKLAQYMVDKGMIDRTLAEKALTFSRHENIEFDEALLILEKQGSEECTSTRSHISGKEAKLLRRLIDNDLLTSEMAAEIARDSLNLKISTLNIMSRIKELAVEKEFEREALELLAKAGIVETSDSSWQEKDLWQIENLFRPLVVQVIKGRLSGKQEKAALECAHLVSEGEMSRQEAVLILRHMLEKKTGLKEAAYELGFAYYDEDEIPATSLKESIKDHLKYCFKKIGWRPALQT